jgi:hypothetical protein
MKTKMYHNTIQHHNPEDLNKKKWANHGTVNDICNITR